MADTEIRLVINGDSRGGRRAVRDLERSFAGLGRAGRGASRVFRNIGRVALGATAAIVGAGVAATKVAIDYESAFTGVRKTVNASEKDLKKLDKGFRNLAKTIPVSANELAGIGEAAGQLGIKTKRIIQFTRVIAELGETTNLVGDEGAKKIARLANVTQMPQRNFRRLGSTVVGLGNNFATTEDEIVTFGLRIAGAGKQVGLNEAEILAFGAALSSVGIDAEAGGTAISRVMIDIDKSVSKGGERLELFADVSGVSVKKFKKQWKTDAAGALTAFIGGLGEIQKEGGPVFEILDDLGLGNIRVRDALLRSAGAGNLVADAQKLANEEWKKGTALSKEAALRFGTTASKLKILKNNIVDLALGVGNELTPSLNTAVDAAIGFVKRLGKVEGVPAKLSVVWEGAQAAGAAAFEQIKAAVARIDWTAVWKGARSGANAVKDVVVRGFRRVDWDAVWARTKQGAGGVKAAITSGFESIDWAALWANAQGGADAIRDTVKEGFLAVDWSAVWSAAFSVVGQAATSFKDVGKFIATSVFEGLRDQDWDRVGAGVAAAVATAFAGAKILKKLPLGRIPGIGKIPGVGKFASTKNMTVNAATVIVNGGIGRGKGPGPVPSGKKPTSLPKTIAKKVAKVAAPATVLAGGSAGLTTTLGAGLGLLGNPFALAIGAAKIPFGIDDKDLKNIELGAGIFKTAETNMTGLVAILRAGVIPTAHFTDETGKLADNASELDGETVELVSTQINLAAALKRGQDRTSLFVRTQREKRKALQESNAAVGESEKANTSAADTVTALTGKLKGGVTQQDRYQSALRLQARRQEEASKAVRAGTDLFKGFRDGVAGTTETLDRGRQVLRKHGQAIDEIPDSKSTKIGETGGALVMGIVRTLTDLFEALPGQKKTRLSVDAIAAMARAREFARVIDSLPSSKTVTLQTVAAGRPPVKRATGGAIPNLVGATRGQDSVLAMVAPGEVVLNERQQDLVGRDRILNVLNATGAPTGGFKFAKGKKPRKRRGRARRLVGRARTTLHGIDAVNVEQDNADRDFGLRVREFDQSREEFLLRDADGNETLDGAAVTQRVGEIDTLVFERERMLGLIDKEKGLLERAMARLRKAQNALRDAIRKARENAKSEAKAAGRIQRELNKERGKSAPDKSRMKDLERQLKQRQKRRRDSTHRSGTCRAKAPT